MSDNISEKHINSINGFMIDRENVLEKGRPAAIGETRMFAGKEHIKTADGWKYHGKGTGKKAQTHKASSEGKSGEDAENRVKELGSKVEQDKLKGLQKRLKDLKDFEKDKKSHVYDEDGDLHLSHKQGVMKVEEAIKKQKEKMKGSSGSSEKKDDKIHISDMTSQQKLTIAKKLGIKNPENLTVKELDKQMIDKNVEKSIAEHQSKNQKTDKKDLSKVNIEEFGKLFEANEENEDLHKVMDKYLLGYVESKKYSSVQQMVKQLVQDKGENAYKSLLKEAKEAIK